jgi:ubiquinone/menaquinone biosynthesis C-methylase UbiE
MNSNPDYDQSYYQQNHLSKLKFPLRFFVKLYYRYLAGYIMAETAGVDKNSRVLDLGCGVGILVEQFNKLGFNSVGVDVNPAAVNNSIKKSKCQLVETTAELDFPDNYFDLVVSREVLEHIKADRIDACIKEWERVGKGKMVHIIAVKERGKSATQDPAHVNVQSEQWWKDKFAAHGYQVQIKPNKLFFSPFGNEGYFLCTKRTDKPI